ncbi:MAG: hypothetical protein VW057_00740, partial [Rhodospirillaceae bacterium]
METPEDETVVLKGQAAVNLWLDGEDAWNEWAAKNPNAEVDFSCVDFSNYGPVSFKFFNFPEGKNSISFSGAEFGDGNISFFSANFSDGEVDFSYAQFGDGNVSFFGANFGDGDIDFTHAIFGDGNVDFYAINFGDSNIDFSHAKCGTGHFTIAECKFGDGEDKSEQKDAAEAEQKQKDAAEADQKGAITFEHVDFGGRFRLQNCEKTGNIQSLSFNGCVFKAGVTLAAELTSIPDLRGTIVTAHIDLDELQVNSKSRAVEDAPKYRRLKELAERNRHHEAALRFFADERRCMRWAKGNTPWQTAWSYLASVLDVIYAGACDYGRSIAWPVGWLGGLISGSIAVLVNCFKIPLWPDALPMVLASSIPFLPAGRASATEHQRAGDVGNLLPYFELWFLGHQFFSFILLFLIGIGLRNRFRL